MGMNNLCRTQCFPIILFILVHIMAMLSTQFALGLKYLQPRQSGSSFKIAIFADLHFGEYAWRNWGPYQDVNSIKAMSSLLDQENPDFVVYLGDVVTANNIGIANASLYWDQAISPTRNRGIPWAIVFGNHDDAHFEWPKEWFSRTGVPPLQCPSSDSSYAGDGNCSFKGTTRLELMTHELRNETLSLSQHGPRHLWPSVSNYVIQISSSDDPQRPVAFLYFLDSGGGSYPEIISRAQAEWFKAKSEEINPDSKVPELIFWHIPSKAYKKVAPPWPFVLWPCKGSIHKEGVCTQEDETGIMKVLEARPSVQAIFVGHDHGNDWCCPYKKMWLCYARHTGYGGYGTWPRGARILEISEQPHFSLKSWIRMENGDVHSHVLLSSHPLPLYIIPSLIFYSVLLLLLFLGIKFLYTGISSRVKSLLPPLGPCCAIRSGVSDPQN